MLTLPANARNLICQHFSVKELLELSTVSSSFYFGINQVKTFKERAWVKLNNTRDPDHLEQMISARDYENLEIISEIWYWKVKSEFLTKPKWKRVKLMVEEFVSSDEFLHCLKLFSKTVETLKLKMIKEAGFERDEAYEEFLEFPFLESLHVEECSSAVLKPFVDQKHLKMLKLDFILPSSTKAEMAYTFTELAVSLDNLVKLEVSQYSMDDFFSFNISPHVKFNLKTLVVYYPFSEVAVENVKKFIKGQGESLENIKLCSWDDPSTVYQIWNSVTQLKTFYQSDGTREMEFDKVEPHKMKVLINMNMRNLHFHFTSINIPLTWLQPMIFASPFLEEIQVPKRQEGLLYTTNSRVQTKLCFISCDKDDTSDDD